MVKHKSPEKPKKGCIGCLGFTALIAILSAVLIPPFDDYSTKSKTNFIKNTIINIFDEVKPQKSPIIPVAFSGLTIGIFVYFFGKLYANGSNFSQYSFWGLIFTINYLMIILVIIAFWIKINLVNTLWILLALSPFTVFTMNMALNADNCHISGFLKTKSRKD